MFCYIKLLFRVFFFKKTVLRKFIKKIKPFRRLYDAFLATKYFNTKYLQILKWMFISNEDTNYTYNLTDKNNLELLKTIESFLNVSFRQLQKY